MQAAGPGPQKASEEMRPCLLTQSLFCRAFGSPISILSMFGYMLSSLFYFGGVVVQGYSMLEFWKACAMPSPKPHASALMCGAQFRSSVCGRKMPRCCEVIAAKDPVDMFCNLTGSCICSAPLTRLETARPLGRRAAGLGAGARRVACVCIVSLRSETQSRCWRSYQRTSSRVAQSTPAFALAKALHRETPHLPIILSPPEPRL